MIYHLVFDLDAFSSYPIDATSPFWLSIARIAASTFIFISGICLSVSYFRNAHVSEQFARTRLAQRAITLLGLGLCISVVTYFAFPEEPILFGILHLLGLSALFGYWFLNHLWVSLCAALGIFLVTPWIQTIHPVTHAFVWIGLEPLNFYTLDYFPLFPWFGIYLCGLAAGLFFYPNGTRRWDIPGNPNLKIIHFLQWVGKKTLLIYLIHQPIMLAILYSLSLIHI